MNKGGQTMKYWMMISNPRIWNIQRFLMDLKADKIQKEDTWVIRDYQFDEFEPGQYGIIRTVNDRRTIAERNGLDILESGIYAVVKIISYPLLNTPEIQNDTYQLEQVNTISSHRYLVRIEYTHNFIDNPIKIEEAEKDSVLSRENKLLRAPQSSVVEISEETFNRVLELKNISISDVDQISLTHQETATLTETEREILAKGRIGHSALRLKILQEKKHCCEICDVSNSKFLHISHIKPWRFSNAEERLDTNNILLLCPNHDKLFDSGYISFDDKGEIIVSERLSQENIKALNITEKKLGEMSEKKRRYLRYHRENIFLKDK